ADGYFTAIGDEDFLKLGHGYVPSISQAQHSGAGLEGKGTIGSREPDNIQSKCALRAFDCYTLIFCWGAAPDPGVFCEK
ncbi:MAG: hypothetical protein AAF486_08790, partial [Pseudomonadota bacterium]